jgi:prepilin peptidase CpaA
VKLLAALAVGFSPLGLVRFLTAVALIGGVLAVAHLLLRRWVPPAAVAPARGSVLRRVCAVERWRIGRRASMPYGVAIAGGGAWMILAGLGG